MVFQVPGRSDSLSSMFLLDRRKEMDRPIITLSIHSVDYEQLCRAAAAVGYSVEDFALLALHKYSEISLSGRAEFVGGRDMYVAQN